MTHLSILCRQSALLVCLFFTVATTTLAQSPADARQVRATQQSLRQRGLYSGALSGRLDGRTRTALRQYQRVVGLPVTGIPDLPTLNSLGITSTRPRYATSRQPDKRPVRKPAARQSGRKPARPGTPKPLSQVTGAVASASRTATVASGRTSIRALDATADYAISRPDNDILYEARLFLASSPQTERWQASVSSGMITLSVPRGSDTDPGPVVSALRRIAGVRSVFVVIL